MAQTAPIKNIVAEHHCDAVFADEFLTDNKSLREPVGRGLHGVGKFKAELFAATQQGLELWGVVGRGNY